VRRRAARERSKTPPSNQMRAGPPARCAGLPSRRLAEDDPGPIAAASGTAARRGQQPLDGGRLDPEVGV
jgi:hypothetical protein